MEQWLNAFRKLGLAFGYTHIEAETKAMQTLIQIQGNLVVSKCLK